MKWLHFGILIAAVATTLLNFIEPDDHGQSKFDRYGSKADNCVPNSWFDLRSMLHDHGVVGHSLRRRDVCFPRVVSAEKRGQIIPIL